MNTSPKARSCQQYNVDESPKRIESGHIVLECYKVEKHLKKNDYGVVALGTDLRKNRQVVIKQFLEDPQAPEYVSYRSMFKQGGLLRIPHPLVVNPIALGYEGGGWFLIRPYVKGIDLMTVVASQSTVLPIDVVTSIITCLAEAVSAIHAKGIVHRDLKPSNIILADGNIPKLIDLETCKDLRKTAETTSNVIVVGSPGYMAPECYSNPGMEDIRSDLYALGIILYFMLTKRLPFRFRNTDCKTLKERTLYNTLIPPSVFNACVTNKLDDACRILLAKCPADRFQTAEAFCTYLRR